MNSENKKLEILIGTLQGNKAKFSTSNSIIVAFNPTEYTLEKSNGFAEATVPGLDSPLIQFSSGKSRSLTLELLLDTYSYGKQEDLRKTYIEKFEKLVAVDGDIHAPPPCKVVWGTMEFIGFVESPGIEGRVVVLTDGETVFHGRVGDVIDGRYRIVGLGIESVDVEPIDGRGQQTLRLSSESSSGL